MKQTKITKTGSNGGSLEERMEAEAKEYKLIAEGAARTSLKNMLFGGMRLVWLQKNTTKSGARNDLNPYGISDNLVSRETRLEKGFEKSLQKIEMSKPTAYRWMNKAAEYAEMIGIAKEDFPEPDTEEWVTLEAHFTEVVARMGSRRVLFGSAKEGSEPHRMELLLSAAENGDAEAAKYLEQIEDGTKSSALAIRAWKGAEATKGVKRNDPVYLAWDITDKVAVGLIPKAFVTLQNGFKNWDTYNERAREDLKKAWEDTLNAAPKELLQLIK